MKRLSTKANEEFMTMILNQIHFPFNKYHKKKIKSFQYDINYNVESLGPKIVSLDVEIEGGFIYKYYRVGKQKPIIVEKMQTTSAIWCPFCNWFTIGDKCEKCDRPKVGDNIQIIK
jgi:hypothetical protein